MQKGAARGSSSVTQFTDAVLRAVFDLVGDATLPSVSRRSALRRYREAGHEIDDVAQARDLDVAVPDGLSRAASRRWTLIAGGTGAVTGAGGLVGLAADVPVLLTTNLTAIGEIACLYGFDVAEKSEHAYAIALLLSAGMPARGRALRAMSELQRLAGELVQGQSWEELGHEVVAPLLRRAARRLAWQLVKRKLAQVVPGVGALVAGGVNAQFTSRTCGTAREVYRERFTAEQ